MDISLQQKVSMTELINSNGWKLLVEKMEAKKKYLEERIFSGACVDMTDYLVSARMVQFMVSVMESPLTFIAQEELRKELEQEEEYDGS